jgi:hypothetical protein
MTGEEIKARVGYLASWINGNQEKMKAMLHACLEKMEANPGEQKSITVHEEVPKEKAAVETFRALMKRHGDQNVAIGCCRKSKIWTQGKGRFQKKLAATHRGMTCHAEVAWCKGHGRDSVAPRTQKG